MILALSFSPQPWTRPGVQTRVGGLVRAPALVPGLPEGTAGLLGLASQGLGRPVPAWNPGGSGDADPGKFAPRGLSHVASFSGFFLVWVVFTVEATLTFLRHPPRVQAMVPVSGSIRDLDLESPSRPWGFGEGPGVHRLVLGGAQPPAGLAPVCTRLPSGGGWEARGLGTAALRAPGWGAGTRRPDTLPQAPAGRVGLGLALRFAGSCLPRSPWLPISRLALLLAPEYAAGQRHVLVRGERVGNGSPSGTARLGSAPAPPVTAVTCASWPRVSPEEGVHPWAQVEIEFRDPRWAKNKNTSK